MKLREVKKKIKNMLANGLLKRLSIVVESSR